MIPATILWIAFPKNKGSDRWGNHMSDQWITANILATCAGFFLVLGFFVTCIAISDQVSTNVTIDKTYRVQEVLNRKANALIPQFRQVLAQEYPQYEKEIFEKISSPGAAEAFLVKYPEIKASVTITEFSKRLSKLREAVWDQKVYREDQIAEASYRKQSPWVLTVFVPGGHK